MPSGGGQAPFIPSSGRLLIIGQDTGSIDEYVNSIGKVPAGLTGYSSVKNLEGLTDAIDYGTGNQHMQYLANKYPDSALALGVYVVDQLDGINSGALRGNLEKMIDILAGFNRPIFFRFGYEADGTWNHYDPGAYKQAFRIAWEIVRNKGVEDKFAFVWQLASYCAGTYQGHRFDAWYPGDQYVDWVGISTFTQGDCNWGPQRDVVNFARQHNKPVIIAEAANQGYQNDELNWRNPLGGGNQRGVSAQQIWNDWYAPWFSWIEQNSDVVKAVAYISADWDSQSNWNADVGYANGYWGDTRVTANNYIKQKWTEEISKNAWLHAGSSGGGGGSAPAPRPQPRPSPSRPNPSPMPPTSSDPVSLRRSTYDMHYYSYSVNPDFSMRQHSYSPSDITTTTYDAWIIENEHLKLTLVPGFGGRVISMINKATGREELYQNPAAAPYLIGSGIFYYDYLVVWGGIFPTFPEPEHGKAWNQKWDLDVITDSRDEVTVVMSFQDTKPFNSPGGYFQKDASMLKCNFYVTLKQGRLAMDARIVMENPTGQDRSHEYWTNVGMAPGSQIGDPKCDDQTEIIAPIEDFSPELDIIYGIGTNKWDQLKWYKNHNGEGIAYPRPNMRGRNFWGVINHHNEEGIFRVADNTQTPGLKIWTFGFPATNINPKAGGAAWHRPFMELWAGRTNQFFQRAGFPPRSKYEIPEAYMPSVGMPSVTHANYDVLVDMSSSGVVYFYFLHPNHQHEVSINGETFLLTPDAANGNKVEGNFGSSVEVTVRRGGQEIFKSSGNASGRRNSNNNNNNNNNNGGSNNNNNNNGGGNSNNNCPPSHPHSQCGRCWENPAQANGSC